MSLDPNSTQMMLTNKTPSTGLLDPASIAFVSLHGVVSTIGIVENLLIVGVVGFHVRRSIISIWILNLAASDLLATISLPFFTLYLARGYTWTLGSTFCRIHSSIFFLNMFVSGFLLAAISLDRCLVVVRPVWAQNYRSIQMVTRICGGIWALAGIFTIPFFIFRDIIHTPSGKIQCYYYFDRLLPNGNSVTLEALRNQRKVGLAIMKLFLAFLIPLTIIIISYVLVSISLSRRGSRRPFRFVRLVVAVVVCFVLCWAPYHLLLMIEVMGVKGSPAFKFAEASLPVAATISFLNCVFNPVLYVFSCPDLCRKIRHSLGAVMESVLVEDLGELARRRSTAQSNISLEFHARKKNSVLLSPLKTDSLSNTA